MLWGEDGSAAKGYEEMEVDEKGEEEEEGEEEGKEEGKG